MERVPLEEIRKLGLKRYVVEKGGDRFVITVHFQYRLLTRVGGFLTVDEVLERAIQILNSYKTLGVLNKKIPIGSVFKLALNGCSIKLKRVDKNLYVLCTAILNSLLRERHRTMTVA